MILYSVLSGVVGVWTEIENCLTETYKSIIFLSAAVFVFHDCSCKCSLRYLFGLIMISFPNLVYQNVLQD